MYTCVRVGGGDCIKGSIGIAKQTGFGVATLQLSSRASAVGLGYSNTGWLAIYRLVCN